MIFNRKSLREVTPDDLREIVQAGLAEHLYLEYKSELYHDNDRGRRELLLDICMFANAQGGVLLLGVSEQRDANGQPTGIPDPGAPLGLELQNPEATLRAYDARVEACIEERLAIESYPIPVGNNRFVFAFRVPNSTAKPHCVRFQGHVYFPCRRERHRIDLEVREIKEMAMRLASQLERAESLLKYSLSNEQWPDNNAVLLVGLVPVFFADFMLDIREQWVSEAFGHFDVRTMRQNFAHPQYGFEGLIRSSRQDVATLTRSGLIKAKSDVTAQADAKRRLLLFFPTAIDILLRNFMRRAQALSRRTNIIGPFLLRMSLFSPLPLVALDMDGFENGRIEAGYREFPTIQVANILDPVEPVIRPLCDHTHQTFGNQGSPYFDAQGQWRGPNP